VYLPSAAERLACKDASPSGLSRAHGHHFRPSTNCEKLSNREKLREPAMGRASCHGIVLSEAHHTRKKAG
jgi:hypothetical protein